jgi:hypothetical protein
MRAATPKKKAPKAIHPDNPESGRFDSINSEKERISDDSEGTRRQTESWHSFTTF